VTLREVDVAQSEVASLPQTAMNTTKSLSRPHPDFNPGSPKHQVYV